MITELTENWKKEFKKAFWDRLSHVERKSVKQLASEPPTQEPNLSDNAPTIENLVESTESFNGCKWKFADEAEYFGERVAIAGVNPETGAITIRHRNGRTTEAQKLFLLKVNSSDRQNE